MKRTRKMMLVTLMATTAIAMMLMQRAFAAPAISTGTCPTQNLLNQLMGGTNTSTSTCPKQAALQSLLNGASTGTSTCPNQAALQSLLNGASTGTSTCPNQAALQSLLNGATTGTSTCPNQAALQSLLNGTSASGSNCPAKSLLNQLIGGNSTGACPRTTCPKASAPTATPAPTATQAPAPTATAAPTATVPPVTGNMSADESKMIGLVNQDRANNGLKPLTFDPTLRVGALAHSQDMSQNNYFSHTSPTQGDFGTRVKAAGVQYTSAGENIAMYPSVDQAEVGFMNSPGHRANILGDYTRVGIGIVYNQSKGEYFITQWFAK